VPHHRGGKGRGESARVSLPYQLESIHNFSSDGYLGYTTVARFLEKKVKYSFLVIQHSALFNNVFEALNLFFLFSRNPAACNCTPHLKTEFWHGLQLEIYITSYE
jgi:hypothetical protein